MDVWYDLTTTGAWLRLGTRLAIRIPDPTERTPPDWWNIETVTGIAAERIVAQWKTKFNVRTTSVETWVESVTGNEPLDDVISMLRVELEEFADGEFDSIEDVRREIVRKQLETKGRLPLLFIGRLEHLIPRVRSILTDVFDETIFRIAGEKRHTIPAIVYRSDEGRVLVEPIVNETIASGILARSIRFAKPGRPPKPANPPVLIARDLAAFPGAWPLLESVVRIPALRADGTLIEEIGYDRDSKVWYEPDDVFADVRVPERPTSDDVERAKVELFYPFHKFPLVDGYGPVLAMIFERVMMPMLTEHLRPLYIIDAPARGSGKSLIARAVGALIKGMEPTGGAWPINNEEEQDKRITSFLRNKDEELHIFDDVTGTISSNALSRLLTMFSYRGRILGESNSPSFRNFATWVFTLNNARVSEDIARRALMVRIDTGMADPSRRTGFDFHPVTVVLARRARLIEAALTIVRAWVCAGSPTDPALEGTLGSFEGWLRTVGAVLSFAGIPNLRAGILAAKQRKAHLDDDRLLIHHWTVTYGIATPLQAAEVVQLAERIGIYEAIVNRPEKPGSYWRARQLANEVLPRLADRIDERHWRLNPTLLE